MDKLSREKRGLLMSRVRSKDTKPELLVRSLVHRLGYRFRLHRKDLPGTPDLAFIARRKVIFVHGCFWHRHAGCKYTTVPKSRVGFWTAKFESNVRRDRRNVAMLKKLGWRVQVIWQCELKNLELLRRRIIKFMELK